MRAVQERDSHLMRPGSGLEPDLLEARVDGIDRRVLLLVDRLDIRLAADLRFKDALAIKRRQNRVVELHVVDPEGHGQVGNVELVLPVDREIMLDQQPTPRAERQSRDVAELRALVLDGVRRRRRLGRAIPDRLHGHGTGGRYVLLHEGR